MLVVFWSLPQRLTFGVQFLNVLFEAGNWTIGVSYNGFKNNLIYALTKWVKDKCILMNLNTSYNILNYLKNNLHTRLFIHASSIGIIISQLSLPFWFLLSRDTLLTTKRLPSTSTLIT